MRFAFLFFALLTTGCAMQNPSFVNKEKILVGPENVVFSKEASQVTRADLLQVADDIKLRASSDVNVIVTYPLQKNEEALANTQKKIIRDTLLDAGVRTPMHFAVNPQGIAAPNKVTIQYEALRAATNCTGTTDDADAGNYTHESDNPYTFGCSRDKYFAAQIARPGDLLGNDAVSPAESQRIGKSLDTYRAGERATVAGEDGLSASDVYSGQ